MYGYYINKLLSNSTEVYLALEVYGENLSNTGAKTDHCCTVAQKIK